MKDTNRCKQKHGRNHLQLCVLEQARFIGQWPERLLTTVRISVWGPASADVTFLTHRQAGSIRDMFETICNRRLARTLQRMHFEFPCHDQLVR